MSGKPIFLKDIIDLIDSNVIALYYKGSYIDDFCDKDNIKQTNWMNEKVCSIATDDIFQNTIEIYLTDINRNY